jgi:hypothetical protein
MSLVGTHQDPLGGIDRLGVSAMKGGYPSDEVQENVNATKLIYLQNKKLFQPKSNILFEEARESETGLLDENNIQDLSN